MSAEEATAWSCPACGLDVPGTANVCMCLRARPPSKAHYPQVFAHMCFHFNGIIPRSIAHASHSIEWRMAEAHGAKVTSDFFPDINEVTHLVYRPGYERSEKVRMAFRRGMPSVPVNWVFDSMLQARRLHEGGYQLRAIPQRALPTHNGGKLQHHQHAFFVQHHDDFQLHGSPGSGGAGSVPIAKQPGQALPPSVKRNAPPELLEVDAEFDYLVDAQVWITDPADSRLAGLFTGMTIVFCGPVPDDAAAAVKAHGAELGDMESATHVFWMTSADKKGPEMLAAIRRIEAEPDAPLVLASATWLLDSMYLQTQIPCEAPYVATDKLIQTLRKRAGAAKAPAQHVDPTAA